MAGRARRTRPPADCGRCQRRLDHTAEWPRQWHARRPVSRPSAEHSSTGGQSAVSTASTAPERAYSWRRPRAGWQRAWRDRRRGPPCRAPDAQPVGCLRQGGLATSAARLARHRRRRVAATVAKIAGGKGRQGHTTTRGDAGACRRRRVPTASSNKPLAGVHPQRRSRGDSVDACAASAHNTTTRAAGLPAGAPRSAVCRRARGMGELQPLGVQGLALEATQGRGEARRRAPGQFPGRRRERVAHQRVADVRHVHADLVCASGLQRALHQGVGAVALARSSASPRACRRCLPPPPA